MALEAAAHLMALIILVASLAALATSVLYSIPYAAKRYALYRDEDGARKSYAKFRLFSILLPTVVVVCFFTVGVGAVALEEGPGRSVFLRLTTLAAILLVAAQLIAVPIWDRHVIALAEDEAAEAGQREVVRKLDSAERESEDRYSEGEVEKSEVRHRLDEMAQGVSDRLDARADDVKGRLDDHAKDVRARLDRQDAEIGRKLDEMLDILRRGR